MQNIGRLGSSALVSNYFKILRYFEVGRRQDPVTHFHLVRMCEAVMTGDALEQAARVPLTRGSFGGASCSAN